MSLIATENRVFRLAAHPHSSSHGPEVNPYIDLFYGALRAHGVEVSELVINDEWLRSRGNDFDGIHLHWPEIVWRIRGESTFSRARGVVGLWRFLESAKRFGMKRIWTVHDIEPHESVRLVDRVGARMVANHCDLLICHNEEAAKETRLRYRPKCPVVVMYHGNYGEFYPPPRPRNVVLRELGVPADLPILCALGFLRNYKGLDIACEAVRLLDEPVRLIIGGRPHPEMDMNGLRAAAERSGGRVVLLDRRLSDQEFSDVLGASEAMLLPYRKITGSGVLLTSWTQGRGIIGSDLVFFREMLSAESDAGRLFPVGDASAMAGAIRDYLNVPTDRRNAAALRLARRYSWDECVLPVAQVFEQWVRRSQRITPS